MTDETKLDLGDLAARAHDLEDTELDDITGGFFRGRPTSALTGKVARGGGATSSHRPAFNRPVGLHSLRKRPGRSK